MSNVLTKIIESIFESVEDKWIYIDILFDILSCDNLEKKLVKIKINLKVALSVLGSRYFSFQKFE